MAVDQRISCPGRLASPVRGKKKIGWLKSGSAARQPRSPRREQMADAVSGRWCEGRGRSRGRWMVNAAEELF